MNITRRRACNKKWYPDEVTARAVVSSLCEDFEMEQMYIYKCRCDGCGGYHATRSRMSKKHRVDANNLFANGKSLK